MISRDDWFSDAGLRRFLAATVLCLPLVLASVACHAADAANTSPTEQLSTSTKTTSRTFEAITKSALQHGKVAGVTYRADIPYLAPGREEKLDLYLPAKKLSGSKKSSAKKRPAIVIIHGGGWSGGAKDARRELEMGTVFARAGYVAVSVEYNKIRGQLWPTNLLDCKNAVRWVRANAKELNVDVDNIGVIGGSAGGHLSLMVGYTSNVVALEPSQPYPGVRDDVQAVVDLYGIADLKTRRLNSKKPGVPGKKWGQQLLNESQQKDPEQWKLGSPVDHVTSSTPPTLIIHGDADKTVDFEQSIALAERLKRSGVEHQLIRVPGGPHTIVLNDKRVDRDLRPDVLAFFEKHLQ